MSENHALAAAGWYAMPNATARHPRVRYWDGSSWVGADRRANHAGTRPRDTPGQAALIILAAGIVCTVVLPVISSYLFLGLTLPGIVSSVVEVIVLATTPVALVVSIVGLVRSHMGRYKAPLSLVVLIVAGLGTVFLVLPIALFATGVWALHFG